MSNKIDSFGGKPQFPAEPAASKAAGAGAVGGAMAGVGVDGAAGATGAKPAPRVSEAVARAAKIPALDDDAYWDALTRCPGGLRIGSKVKKRADWLSIADDQGRTPIMRLAAYDGRASWALFTRGKRALNAAQAKDRQGRSLWAYAMAHGVNMDPEDLDWLLRHAPYEADHHGRGLFGQALSVFCQNDDPLGLLKSPFYSLADAQDAVLFLNRHAIDALPSPAAWWGATEAAQDDLARAILASHAHGPARGLSRMGENAWALANELPIDGLSPRLLGVIALIQAAAEEGFCIQVPEIARDQVGFRTYSILGARLGFGGGGTSKEIAQKKRLASMRPLLAGGVLPSKSEIPDALARQAWPGGTGLGRFSKAAEWLPEWEALSEANALRQAMAEGARQSKAQHAADLGAVAKSDAQDAAACERERKTRRL